MLDLQLEIRADFGVDVEQRVEHRPIEPQRQHLALARTVAGLGVPFEHLHVAEAVAGAQHAERDLLAALAALHDRARGRTR